VTAIDVRQPFTIAEVAEETGVSAHTLRYYERIGLLDVGRQPSGHRGYVQADVDRAMFITRLRATAMPIREIQRYFAVAGLAPDDFRRQTQPRFQGDNLAHNLALVDVVKAVAARYGCTPGQVALAWVLAQGDDVVPIPGTRRRHYLEENLASTAVVLDAADLARLESLKPAGDRYGDMSAVHAESKERVAP
jgi:DNA-binding transcriptional MerR regulator